MGADGGRVCECGLLVADGSIGTRCHPVRAVAAMRGVPASDVRSCGRLRLEGEHVLPALLSADRESRRCGVGGNMAFILFVLVALAALREAQWWPSSSEASARPSEYGGQWGV